MRDGAGKGPTLVFIIGAPAVGKVSVGQALARLTGFRLFHHHQVIDLLAEYFAFGSPAFDRLVVAYRAQLFAEAARANLDLITTSGWRFNLESDAEATWSYVQPYLERGGQACFVELLAPLAVRLARNATENRRRHKKVEATAARIREHFLLPQAWDVKRKT